MYQTDKIKDLARELGIDYGNSDSLQDQLRKISEQVGMDHYNSLYDNNQLQKKLEELNRQKNLNNSADNNARAAKAGANAASKSGNPRATGMGTAAKTADKAIGGRATEKLGKAAGAATKLAGLKGKMAQKAIDKMSKNGTLDRISKAMAMRNGILSSKSSTLASGSFGDGSKSNSKGGLFKSLGSSLFNNKRKSEETSDGEGFASFSGSFKVVKVGLIVTAIFLPVAVLVVLFMSSSRLYEISIGLGQADNLTDKIEEEKINKKTGKLEDDDLENDIKDENSSAELSEDKIKFRNNKLSELNLVQVASKTNRYLRRKYNEATLDDLRDFYPYITELGKTYDENMVYDFFFKMYNLYTYYNSNLPVDENDPNPILNLPLLMATLMQQSDDMNVIFESNLEAEDRKKGSTRKQPVEDYLYSKDWSGTVLSKNSSTHDMEILAQRMVSKRVKESCKDSNGTEIMTNVLKDEEIGTQTLTCEEGQTYSVSEPYYGYDDEKYKEFLKEFIEKKYYEEGEPLDPYFVDNGEDVIPEVEGGSGSHLGTASFTKYGLSEDELLKIASLCYKEQGNAVGAAAEASLMANLFETSSGAQKYRNEYGETGAGLYHYARESGWWYNAANHMDSKSAPSDVVEYVRKVLVDGMRTLPGYVNEHDCYDCNGGNTCSSTGIRGDICKLDNGSEKLISMADIKNRSNYKSGVTKIYNVYGAEYIFYSFPTSSSDPFGYDSNSLREELGDCHYNVETWEPVDCKASSSDAENEFAREMIDIANSEYENNQGYSDGKKYTDAYGTSQGTPWCTVFAWYVSSQTSVGGKSLYPDIISLKSASTGDYIRYFNSSRDSNIKFYYNDSCSNLSGKNKDIAKYIPKPGDYVFFDWDGRYYDISSDTQDHTGIVEKYEDGYIYTIEGNSNNTIQKRKYEITSCQVIGFGSWY